MRLLDIATQNILTIIHTRDTYMGAQTHVDKHGDKHAALETQMNSHGDTYTDRNTHGSKEPGQDKIWTNFTFIFEGRSCYGPI